jgi:hypothetical protein
MTDAKEVGVGNPAEEKTFCHRTWQRIFNAHGHLKFFLKLFDFWSKRLKRWKRLNWPRRLLSWTQRHQSRRLRAGGLQDFVGRVP